jgi:hypothetical protein
LTADGNIPLSVPPELVELVAERAAELLAERQPPAEDGWLRGAAKIAAYVDCPPSRIYALAACKPPRIPVERDGSAVVTRRSEFDSWVRNGESDQAVRRCPPVAHHRATPHGERHPGASARVKVMRSR